MGRDGAGVHGAMVVGKVETRKVHAPVFSDRYDYHITGPWGPLYP